MVSHLHSLLLMLVKKKEQPWGNCELHRWDAFALSVFVEWLC